VDKRSSKDRRLTLVAVVLFLGLSMIAGKLVIVQGLQAGRYKKLAREQRDTLIKVPARRGTVFDREGEILAISEDVTTVYATPYQVKSRKRTAAKIAGVLGEDPADVEKKLKSRSGFVYLARKLDNRLADRIKKMDLEGIGFVQESKRLYPMGHLASQVIGVVDLDNTGRAGLELFYEKTLGGKTGEILLERDATGNPIPGSEKKSRHAVDGNDIRLTLDKDIQSCVEEAVERAVERHGARAGTAIVMDCNTGDILAMATSPSYDPNERDEIDPESMRNRAVTDVYEPGSALKVVTAVGALQEKVVTPDTSIFVPSQLPVADEIFKDATPTPDRQMTFSQIISKSSNVGTIEVGLKLGPRRLSEYIERVGLGHRTGIDFPGEVAGIVQPLASWSGTSVATISIGQGISITPLQLACTVSGIANGGRKVPPHFLGAKVSGKDFIDAGLGGLGEQVLSRDACMTLVGILEQVVSPGGTGMKAAVNYYRVGGKTGTAEKPVKDGGYGGTYMATFVGFAPVEHPRLVAMVVLDEPTPIWGGEVSAPVFKEIMDFSLSHLKIPPSWGSIQR